MKLLVVKMVGAIALQFTKAPHYVDFTDEQDGFTVNFKSVSGNPTFSATCEKKDKKCHTSINIGVPNNGGLNAVFGGELKNDKHALAAGKAVRAALEAYAARQAEDIKVDVL